MATVDQRALGALLAWYEAMGVADPVGEVSLDWRDPTVQLPSVRAFVGAPQQASLASGRKQTPSQSSSASDQTAMPHARGKPQRPPPAQPTPSPPMGAPLGDEAGSLAEAERLAMAAETLGALKAALATFEGCPLKRTAKNLCFYRGQDQARLMLIGEGPGRDEDQTGQPFVGRAGQLLDRMLAAIGQSDATTHITNVVYWRPPGNRTPTDFEVAVCRPFLERQVSMVDPDIIVLLGGAAAKTMLETTTGITKVRGKWQDREIGGRKRAVVATLHPAYLLRVATAKRHAWMDLQSIASRLEDGAPSNK
ncbi:MAG: uracil-DNA glycosylase [Pseudomonadota bacterium]